MPRLLSILPVGLLALTLVLGVAVTTAPPASALTTIAATTTCANGEDNTGGLGIICEVTIDNTITASGGSATVTVRECHGAANDAEALCTTTGPTLLTEPVTAVTQCNGSAEGGGSTLECSVEVTNTFIGVSATPTAVTVNQCNGSGDNLLDDSNCDPFPATTTGATITQCNDSANGGTLAGFECTATGTEAAAHIVTINQCNNSANGGGSLVICSANITNSVVAATAAPTAVPTAVPTGVPTASPLPDTSTIGTRDGMELSGAATVLFAGLLLVAAMSLGMHARQRAG